MAVLIYDLLQPRPPSFDENAQFSSWYYPFNTVIIKYFSFFSRLERYFTGPTPAASQDYLTQATILYTSHLALITYLIEFLKVNFFFIINNFIPQIVYYW